MSMVSCPWTAQHTLVAVCTCVDLLMHAAPGVNHHWQWLAVSTCTASSLCDDSWRTL